MENFRSLFLAKRFYAAVNGLRLPRHLSNQLRRAAASVVCNLAEGRARPTRPDQRRFFYIAFGSIKECKSILDIGGVGDPVVADLADHLAAAIYKLCKAV